MVVDLTVEPVQAEPLTDKELGLMQAMGISSSMDSFFASTTTLVNVRDGEPESEKTTYFRQDIWSWLEISLSKDIFKWMVWSISPIYDIHALYTKVITIANKATLISHALEVKKIFEMPFNGSDIFQYHSELQQQIEMVQAQGESLGLDSVIPPWMEQSLLLIAAWKSPNYRKIALEFTMDNVQVEIDTLVGELQKQQLLTTHLNRSNDGGSRSDRPRGERSETRVHQATTAGVKYCFGFQRGAVCA